MNEKIKICIADDNELLSKNLANFLREDNRIEVVKVCNNGKEVLQVLDEKEIDILVMDLIMPYIDGLGVLEKLAEDPSDNKPNIIIVSAIAHDSWKFKLFDLGVNYYMMKPINMDILLKRIIEVHENSAGIRKQKVEKDISQKLHELAIFPNLVGYQYIKESIEILIERPVYAKNFRENIYALIAQENGIKEFKIEKAINNAIHTSWSKDKEKIVSVFKSKVYKRKAPSARVFITTIAEDIADQEHRKMCEKD